MHPQLRLLLGQTVRFRPLGAPDGHGQATFGRATGEVACRYSYPNRRRAQRDRPETVTAAGAVYLDCCDYRAFEDVIKVGALVVLPDGVERPIAAVELHYGHLPEGPGANDDLDHAKILWS